MLVLAQADGDFGDPATPTLPAVAAGALVLLEDIVRADAPETLAYFAEQGVTVKVISGDNPVTVGAVARRAGLAGLGPQRRRQARCPATTTSTRSPTRSTRTRCSVGSRRTRSGRWCARCSTAATPWR